MAKILGLANLLTIFQNTSFGSPQIYFASSAVKAHSILSPSQSAFCIKVRLHAAFVSRCWGDTLYNLVRTLIPLPKEHVYHY